MVRVHMTALLFSGGRRCVEGFQASRLRIYDGGKVTLSQLQTFMKSNPTIQTITLENGVVFEGWDGAYVQELDINYEKVLKQVQCVVDDDDNHVLTLVDHVDHVELVAPAA